MVVQNSNEFNFLMNRNKQSGNALQKNLEKLASGYQINRAADDAAGLAVSEKMRGILASLGQGVKNINDGISYIRSVDGSSQEIHNMLHRLYVLADQAANGTYDNDVDRRSLDLEYQQLLDEIDQMTDLANFNDLPLFEKHLERYGKDTGNICHDEKPIIIDSTNDALTIGYTTNGTHKEYTVMMKHGRYLTPEELADEIDTDLYKNVPELIIGVDEKKRFTMQVEGGDLDYIVGTGSDIFYKSNVGNARGILLGVTEFLSDTARLLIEEGYNDEMKFRLSNEGQLYTVKIDTGDGAKAYYHHELVDEINRALAEAGLGDTVRAVGRTNENGHKIIAIDSDDAITGLAGNFIRIDSKGNDPKITKQSPIYDIAYYADELNYSSTVDGKRIIPNGVKIVRDRNDYFVVHFSDYDSGGSSSYRINLLEDGELFKDYSITELADTISRQFEDYGIRASVTYDGNQLHFETDQVGELCNIQVDTVDVPSDFMIYDLFDAGNLTVKKPSESDSYYSPAYFKASRQLTDSIHIDSSNNELVFDFEIRDRLTQAYTSTQTVTLTLEDGTYTKAQLRDKLNTKLGEADANLGRKFIFNIDNNGRLMLTVREDYSVTEKNTISDDIRRVSCRSTSKAYSTLIKGTKYYASLSQSRGGKVENIYSPTSSTGGNPISKKAGVSVTGAYYADDTSKTTRKEDDYIKYTDVEGEYTDGRSVNTASGESQVGDLVDEPAYATFADIGSVFTVVDGANGVCRADKTFSFTLKGYNGKQVGTININVKDKTRQEFLDALQAKLTELDYGTAEFSGNTLKITSNANNSGIGASIRGTGLCSAKLSDLVGTAGAEIKEADNKVVIPPTCTIPSVNTNLPITLYDADDPTDTTKKQNNVFTFTYGSNTYNLHLTAGYYNSVSSLCREINDRIAAEAADSGVTATYDGTAIILRGSANKAANTLSIDTSGSVTGSCSFVKTRYPPPDLNDSDVVKDGDLYKTRATMTIASVGSHMNFTPTADNNTLVISYNYKSGTTTVPKSITVNFAVGATYTGSDIAYAINHAAGNDEYGINAYYDSGKLILKTKDKSSGEGAEFTSVGGTSKLEQYKTATTNKPGGKVEGSTYSWPSRLYNNSFWTLDRGSLVVDENNNHIQLQVGSGAAKDYYLEKRTYTSLYDLAGEVADKLKDDFNVSFDGTTLAIASKNLGATDLISVGSGDNSIIFKCVEYDSNPASPYCTDRRTLIVGSRDISQGVKLNYWDNKMTFKYGDNLRTIDITIGNLDENTNKSQFFTADEIVQSIQDQLDAKLGFRTSKDADGNVIRERYLEVSLNNQGQLVIGAPSASNIPAMRDFQGLLFDRILQGAVYTEKDPHSYVKGKTEGETLSYIVGRNDLNPESKDERESGKNVLIYTGINDQLVFDLTYGDDVHEISIRVPGGAYTREELVQALQDGGREIIKNLTDEHGENFEYDFFNVSLGLEELEQFGVKENNTGITSENKIVMWCKLPEDGSHDKVKVIVDGVRGTMAYRVFYDSTMSPSPSTIYGCADLSNGLTIDSTNDILSFQISGKNVNIRMRWGEYKDCDEVCDMLNNAFEGGGYDVAAMTSENHILFYSTKNGDYAFTKFMGSGADDVFYGTEKRSEDYEIGIQTGRRTDSYIWIKKTRVDDHLMRINTTGITTVERAMKAMNRLDAANNYLSRWRALSGANENRAVHTLNRTNIYIENLSAADSQLRDTNVADEVSKLTKNQILMQASMFSAVKDHQSSVLNVLA